MERCHGYAYKAYDKRFCTASNLLIGIFTAAAIFMSFLCFAESKDPQRALEAVSNTAIAICRGGTIKGIESGLIVSVDGGAKVVILKGLADLDANGKVNFTKKEWDGISPLIPDKPDQAAWNQCVIPITNALIKKLNPAESEQCEKIRLALQTNSEQQTTLRDAMDATSGEQRKRLQIRIEELKSWNEMTHKTFPECMGEVL